MMADGKGKKRVCGEVVMIGDEPLFPKNLEPVRRKGTCFFALVLVAIPKVIMYIRSPTTLGARRKNDCHKNTTKRWPNPQESISIELNKSRSGAASTAK